MLRYSLLAFSIIPFALGRWFLVQDFIEHTQINSITFVHCLLEQPDHDVPLLARKLHTHFHGTVAYIDISGSGEPHRTQLPFANIVSYHSRHRVAFVLNLECNASRPFLLDASQENGFNSSYRWLFFAEGSNSTRCKSLLAELNINIDAQITLAFTHGKTLDSYGVYDVYGSIKRRGGVLKFDYLGNSTPNSGWQGANRPRDDLHQIELRAVVSTLNEHQPQSLEGYLRVIAPKPRAYNAPQFAYQIIRLLQRRLNFRLKHILASTWHLDAIANVNSSAGLVGQLVTNKVDFSAVPLSMQKERIPLFDPTIEILRGKFFTLFRHPKKALGRNIFLQPFQDLVWVGVVVLLGWISAIFSATFVVQGAKASEMPLSLLITLGTLTQQAAVSGWMRLASGKVLLLSAFGCCMLLLQFYSSFIIGYQLAEQPRTINTMQQLIASGMPIAIENLSYNRDYFMRTTDPIAIELYEKRVLPSSDGFLNVSDGIALIKKGGHAFHCDTTYGYTHILETFTESQICELHRVMLYPHRVIHLPVTKGSPLRELFKVHLQIIRESGVLAYQQSRFRAVTPRCIRDNHHMEPIALYDVVSGFLLLAVGVLISTLLISMILASDWHLDLIGRNTSQGVIGQLQMKEVDFSITPLAVTPERIPIIDFTIEVAHGTSLLWVAISVMFCSLAAFFGLSIVCSRRRNQDRSYVDLFGEQVFLSTVGILSQQGFHNHLSGRGTNRLLLFVGMGFSLVMIQFYSSFIVGYQLISPPKTITSLERLVDSELKMSVENLSYQHDFFRRTKNPAAMKLYETKILPNKYGFVNLTFGVQLVKRGGYAFHCETSYGNTLLIETLTEREICELQQIQLYPQRPVNLPLIKGSPLRELFKTNLQLMKERGLTAYHHGRNYMPTPKCNKKSSNHTEAIYLVDVKFAFLLLAIGMAASVALLVGEVLLNRTRHWWANVPEDFVWLN
uniref:Ionotropic receptor 75a N-terminal domain-containing protein n=1 Tax=Anopheles farauti TaxID=69004 RepID=A0A182Q7Q3_9DIPT